MTDLLNSTLLDNTVRQWLTALIILAVSFVLLSLLLRFLSGRLRRWAARTQNEYDDLISDLLHATRTWFLLLISAYLGSLYLTLPDRIEIWFRVVVIAAVFVQAGLWGNGLIDFGLKRLVRAHLEEADSRTVLRMTGWMARVVLWTLILLLILDNIPGVSVTGLIASLGVAGIAVGLALQNILSDLFASMSIVLDRPFVVGDFIVVGDMLGVVENIGIKSTRVRSLSGELLVFSNSDLLNSRIRNYKTLYERRVVNQVGVTYQTAREKLERIPSMIRQAVAAQTSVRFDRAHLAGFGDSSIDFEYVYYVLSPDYAVHMDVQQGILLEVHRAFEKEGIEFAYPTRTVFLAREAPG
jgi:small-conductance mechanosensitive channel